MKHLSQFIQESILITERKVVLFDGHLYPNDGWAVIMLGGPGSGKGWFKNNKLPIDGKNIDVDELKKAFVRLGFAKELLHGEEYNPKNPEHVSAVHMAVKQHDWKQKILNMFFNSVKNTGHLSNIIFDITGKKPEEAVTQEIINVVKGMGYKVCCVWVVANREEAMIRNIERDRSVSDDILHGIHSSIAKQLPDYFQKPGIGSLVDELWIYFSTTNDIHRQYNSKQEDADALLNIEKVGVGDKSFFKFDDKTTKRLGEYLSTNGKDSYISSDELKKKYGVVELKKVKEKDKKTGEEKEVEKRVLHIQRDKLKDNSTLRK